MNARRDLPPLLASLSQISIQTSAPTPKLLILAHKTDLLVRLTSPSSPCPPNLPSAIRSTARERLKSILTREMDRLKSARGGGGIGGRIEGMGKVAGAKRGGWLSQLFGGGQDASVGDEGGEGVEDEGSIWGGKGEFRWEDVEGVDIEWGVSGLGMVDIGKQVRTMENQTSGDGLNELEAFLLSV